MSVRFNHVTQRALLILTFDPLGKEKVHTVHHPINSCSLSRERSPTETRLTAGAIPKILPSLDKIRENMGEKLQWAVKNGDLDAVKALVEQVCSLILGHCTASTCCIANSFY